MKRVVIVMTFGCLFLLYASAFAEDRIEREGEKERYASEAPLPALGLTLLGQLGAGVLGWSIVRSRRGV